MMLLGRGDEESALGLSDFVDSIEALRFFTARFCEAFLLNDSSFLPTAAGPDFSRDLRPGGSDPCSTEGKFGSPLKSMTSSAISTLFLSLPDLMLAVLALVILF